MRRFVDATGGTNRPGFQPLGCGSICTQGFALGWYRSAPLALETIGVGVGGRESTRVATLPSEMRGFFTALRMTT